MVQNKSGRDWMAPPDRHGLGIAHTELGYDSNKAFSFVYIYDGQNSGPKGPRLMVFIHTELNDTTGGDFERFAKSRTYTKARSNAAVYMAVGASGDGQGKA